MTATTEGTEAKARGRAGESFAQSFLTGLGFTIVETNYRFGKGEIDIIARDGDVLVFCEVKTRERDQFGPPEYALTLRKQLQIRKVAAGYLFEHELAEQECRFDVIAIRMVGGRPEINHIWNAF
jgi:putative endonuclease